MDGSLNGRARSSRRCVETFVVHHRHETMSTIARVLTTIADGWPEPRPAATTDGKGSRVRPFTGVDDSTVAEAAHRTTREHGAIIRRQNFEDLPREDSVAADSPRERGQGWRDLRLAVGACAALKDAHAFARRTTTDVRDLSQWRRPY